MTPCKTQLVPLLIYRVFGVTPVLRYEEPSGLGSGVVLSEGTPEPVVKVVAVTSTSEFNISSSLSISTPPLPIVTESQPV